ncbi:hypothetical protein M8R19_26680 [Pseudomonas sp. R3.Fl]|uniref:hypothetical protein n=1 Tax=Pseudomonas TaxID=286 RepID=UPI00201E5E46|nr:hypothetical protein [Pseudomonas sp. R3.Fl]MCL6692279.1 hypothetical protein [Pseudomonas sp. R3.Fl]
MLPEKLEITLRPRSLVTGALLSPLAVIAAVWVWSLPWESNNAPGWVQAIGSVLAIGAAIWIAERTHNRDRTRSERSALLEEVRVAWLAECATYEAMAAVYSLQDQLNEGRLLSDKGIHLARLEQAGEMLRAILTQQLPHRLVNTTFQAISYVAEVVSAVAGWSPILPSEHCEVILQRHATSIGECRVTIEQEYRRLAQQAGVAFTQRIVL